MRLLITGGKGMLGRTLQRRLASHTLSIADLPETDITDPAGLAAAMRAFRPDTVIHCAAMTRVDDCETHRELAYRLNETGSRNVAAAARDVGARVIAISTDYVFDGHAARPYRETDEPAPATVYGASKLAGEQAIAELLPGAHTILRIAWLFGPGGPSFVHALMKLGADADGAPLKVVDDQIGNPTSTDAVASVLEWLLDHPLNGIVHGSCEGETTWYGLARELFARTGLRRPLQPCTTAEFPRPAPRPANSRLEKGRLHEAGFQMPDWRDALDRFLQSEQV
ncbi:MAG: dTDP-4-dehydrorhamnose reductase [Kiritimatiellae bacterium]|nr:dTDP-4-dehydrorhamnose reductase [Kiritimatiellia bacterium]